MLPAVLSSKEALVVQLVLLPVPVASKEALVVQPLLPAGAVAQPVLPAVLSSKEALVVQLVLPVAVASRRHWWRSRCYRCRWLPRRHWWRSRCYRCRWRRLQFGMELHRVLDVDVWG